MLTRPILLSATANPEASRDFYEKKLGFSFISDDTFALVFKVGDLDLRVQKVEKVEEVAHTVLGWSVENIEQTVTELNSKGIKFEIYEGMEQDKLGIWASPSGAKIAWFKNPDNNTLSITEY